MANSPGDIWHREDIKDLKKHLSVRNVIPKRVPRFLRVTIDGTWIQHYTPKSTWQSTKWKAAGEARTKRPKMRKSAGKVMVSEICSSTSQKIARQSIAIIMGFNWYLWRRKSQKKRPVKKKKLISHQDKESYCKNTRIISSNIILALNVFARFGS